ncbi:MAG: SMC-Scp complex subunit ScpB [Spongiibacteraceae bacterium]|nr:SMC-Scp complex subunit ScpB [Spongiibacteraceae bacterium]
MADEPVAVEEGCAEVPEALLQRIVEGALLAAGKPLAVADLAALFESHERPSSDAIRRALAAIGEQCAGRGFELKEVASGFRFQVAQEVAPWIARLWEEKPQRYSRALLETLALIAYRQPITRGDIEEIRGVAVATNIMKTLLEREWVRVVGHKDVPGRPALYATTRKFLDYFNLKNLDELPTLAEIRDLDTFTGELALEGVDTEAVGGAGASDEQGAATPSAHDMPADDAAAGEADHLSSEGESAARETTPEPDQESANEPERGEETAAEDHKYQGDAPADT